MKSPLRDISIIVQNEKYNLPKGAITLFADLILKRYRVHGGWQVSIIFVDDDKIAQLNKHYLKKKGPTDVIAFNLDPDNPHLLLGEIYIDVDQAISQARQYHVPLRQELLRLTAHGIFHLLGYTDDSQENRKLMTHLEDQVLAEFSQFGGLKNSLTIS